MSLPAWRGRAPAGDGWSAGRTGTFPRDLQLCASRGIGNFGLGLDQPSHLSAISVSVTVMAPPIRVAIWAKGISCIRFAAVRMATSPVPP